jgi:hypothetical protein
MASFDKRTRGLLHIEFILPSFIRQLPSIMHKIDRTPRDTMDNAIKDIVIKM